MKKILLIAFAFLLGTFVNAQETTDAGNLRLGVNCAFYGSGDLTGPAIYGEYAHQVNSYFSVVPRMFCGVASSYEERDYIHYQLVRHNTSFGVSVAGRFTPTSKVLNRFSADLGLVCQKFSSTFAQKSENLVLFISEGDSLYLVDTHSDISYSSENLFGLTGSLCMDVIRTYRITSGIRFDMLTSFNGGSFNCESLQMGIYVGVKL